MLFFSVRNLQPRLQSKIDAQGALEYSHGRHAIQLSNVWEEIPPETGPQCACESEQMQIWQYQADWATAAAAATTTATTTSTSCIAITGDIAQSLVIGRLRQL